MYEHSRGSARQRGYTAEWDKAAKTYKVLHPFCVGCHAIGLRGNADVVDHVEPHKGDPAKFWDQTMWQSACRWHHDVVKKRLEMMFERGEIAIDDLRLNSAVAKRLSRRIRMRIVDADGWREG